jgi:hypothetical protein
MKFSMTVQEKGDLLIQVTGMFLVLNIKVVKTINL